MLLKRLWVSYSLKTMYHNFHMKICFRIICQDEENGDEQHENPEQLSLHFAAKQHQQA